MDNPVIETRDGPILVLTLNDPARANPLSSEMVASLSEALDKAASDVGVRAVILAGAGRNFSAGDCRGRGRSGESFRY